MERKEWKNEDGRMKMEGGDHKIIILKEERESMIINNKGGWGTQMSFIRIKLTRK